MFLNFFLACGNNSLSPKLAAFSFCKFLNLIFIWTLNNCGILCLPYGRLSFGRMIIADIEVHYHLLYPKYFLHFDPNILWSPSVQHHRGFVFFEKKVVLCAQILTLWSFTVLNFYRSVIFCLFFFCDPLICSFIYACFEQFIKLKTLLSNVFF